MEKIESFKINHRLLKRGVYVSRVDTTPNGDKITTFDIRVCEPNHPMDGAAAHTLEHIIATYLRNRTTNRHNVVYFGPMGCLTGFYFIMQGKLSPFDVWGEVRAAFNYASQATEIPGVSPEECGNFEFHDLEKARKVASGFVAYLDLGIRFDNTNYPLNSVVFVCAMEAEAQKIKNIAKLPCFEGIDIHVEVCGIGKANAAAETERIINTLSPSVVVSFGFAGGIKGHALEPGDLIAANHVMYHDVWCGKPNELGQIQGMPSKFQCVKPEQVTLALKKELGMGNPPMLQGGIATGDAFVTDDKNIKELSSTIVAVDMESAAIAQICYKHGVNFAAYKIISDVVGSEDQLKDYEEATTFEEPQECMIDIRL